MCCVHFFCNSHPINVKYSVLKKKKKNTQRTEKMSPAAINVMRLTVHPTDRLHTHTRLSPGCALSLRRCEISKNLCCRNLAVEKAVSELPTECTFCLKQFPRSSLERHQKEECQDRCAQKAPQTPPPPPPRYGGKKKSKSIFHPCGHVLNCESLIIGSLKPSNSGGVRIKVKIKTC